MKQIDIINAYKNINDILALSLPYPIIKKIRNMYKDMKNEYDFYDNEAKKIINKYSLKNENGENIVNSEGNCEIPKINAHAFFEEMHNLDNFECDFKYEKIIITEFMIGNQNIKLNNVLKLEPFITFE